MWSDNREREFIRLYNDNLSFSLIAQELGGFDGSRDGGRSACVGKAHRLGLLARDSSKIITRRRTPPPRIIPPTPIPAPTVMSKDYLCSLFDLTDKSCRWPVWEEETPFKDQHYCGIPSADIHDSRPYCAQHSKMVYAAREPRSLRPYWTRDGKAA